MIGVEGLRIKVDDSLEAAAGLTARVSESEGGIRCVIREVFMSLMMLVDGLESGSRAEVMDRLQVPVKSSLTFICLTSKKSRFIGYRTGLGSSQALSFNIISWYLSLLINSSVPMPVSIQSNPPPSRKQKKVSNKP